jgi:hypothetical protein
MSSCSESIPSFVGGFDYCAPNFIFGEIEQVIISPLELESGDPYPTDVTDETAWDALLDPSEGEPVAYLIPVRGTIDEPERPEIEASLYRKAYPPQRYSLALNVDDLSDIVHNALRELTNKRVRIWWISGGYIFGSATGIEADVNTWQIIEEGEDSMHRYHIHATWRAKEQPYRYVSPFADAVVTGTTV